MTTGNAQAKNALTDYLRQIGEEQVTICIDGIPRTVSKSEALARKLYLLAMGGVEEVTNQDGETVKIFHKADHRVAKMIREFSEGKAAVEPAQEGKKNAKPGSFDSSVGRRLSVRLDTKPQRPKTKSKGI